MKTTGGSFAGWTPVTIASVHQQIGLVIALARLQLAAVPQ